MTALEGTILITGAAKRVGRALALALGSRDTAIAIHYGNSEKEAAEVAKALRDRGAKADIFACDLADAAETATLVGRVTGAMGPLTGLVNCASTFEPDEIETMTPQSWAHHVETNLHAPAILCQAFAAQAAAGRDACIVNITDQRVFKLTPQFLTYTLSKAGLSTLTTTLAQALGPRGIRVNAVAPGPTLRNARQSEDDWVKQNAATILGRGATPSDICDAVRYLLSATAVTGQTICVDGGQHLVWRTADVAVTE